MGFVHSLETRNFNVVASGLCACAHPVFGVDVCAAVDEVLGTLDVSRPDGHVQRATVQLRRTEQKRLLL